ncbi:TadE/TadG family type IV pilus assembly protein, partial [Planctomycetota bacterium]
MSALPATLRAKVRGLSSDQSGQALVFCALTAFMLASFVLFVAELGQVQNAADECAYGGSLYEANVISSVAYLNEAMAYMYYDGLRYAVDTTRTGVLASLKRYGPPYPEDAKVYDDEDADAPGFSGSPVSAYDRAYNRARDQVPQIERTLNMMARWEWGMALGCEDLVEMEIYRAAREHGIEAVAIYPARKYYPGDGIEFDLHILRLEQDGEWVGWRIWNQEGYTVEARNIGQYHWIISDPNRNVFDIERLNETTYRIQTPTDDITLERFSDTHVRVTRIRNSKGGQKKSVIDTQYVDGFGWTATITDDNYTIGYRPFRDGGYWLDLANHQTGATDSAGLRVGPNGHLQQWN